MHDWPHATAFVALFLKKKRSGEDVDPRALALKMGAFQKAKGIYFESAKRRPVKGFVYFFGDGSRICLREKGDDFYLLEAGEEPYSPQDHGW